VTRDIDSATQKRKKKRKKKKGSKVERVDGKLEKWSGQLRTLTLLADTTVKPFFSRIRLTGSVLA
jgi:hypothetical protein